MIESKFIERIAEEVAARPEQVAAAVALFDKGSTVPFVARYRKDHTGNLDEVRLERIERRNVFYTALSNRRDAILGNIENQGQLTPELRAQLEACTDAITLEDLYLPYKKARRTKAAAAREKGLEPLADFLWAQELGEEDLGTLLARYVSAEKGVLTVEEALEGALHIVSERVAVDPVNRASLREAMREEGKIATAPTKVAEGQKTKFEGYYHFTEAIKTIPSHRLLAVLRGVRVAVLRMEVLLDDEGFLQGLVARHVKAPGSVFEAPLRAAIDDAYKRLLRPGIENEVIGIAHEAADEEAIRVFRENARNVLLAPPAGNVGVLGVDPGHRSGCKLAVVDRHGVYQETATIYLTEPEKDEARAAEVVKDLLTRHALDAIAVGNGTGGREAARFINGVIKDAGRPNAFVVFVNEAGASVYSASKIARDEFPDLDVTVRGAISIARRLQDPLAELVKLEPRSIGVGQYQHDVNQKKLREGLYTTVESCVNHVGVDVNTASAELLRYVSGVQSGTAQNIVAFRTEHNGIKSRSQFMEVSGIGEKSFEQCAGFLRIRGGEHPLDATGIHPEAYPVVEAIAARVGVPVAELIGNHALLERMDLTPFASETVGRHTLKDIREELLKPGRDPRAEFKVPRFVEGVEKVSDVSVGMELEGVVTNVTDFGAFVDVGVHQDGLVHLSELTNRFVKDPREVVKVGEIVRAKVIKVDLEASRISLSMKALLPPPPPRHRAAVNEGAAASTGDGRGPARPAESRPGPGGGERPARPRPVAAESRPGPGGGGAARRPKPKAKAERKPSHHERLDTVRAKEAKENMNTALADQLELLREKFNNGKG